MSWPTCLSVFLILFLFVFFGGPPPFHWTTRTQGDCKGAGCEDIFFIPQEKKKNPTSTPLITLHPRSRATGKGLILARPRCCKLFSVLVFPPCSPTTPKSASSLHCFKDPLVLSLSLSLSLFRFVWTDSTAMPGEGRSVVGGDKDDLFFIFLRFTHCLCAFAPSHSSCAFVATVITVDVCVCVCYLFLYF